MRFKHAFTAAVITAVTLLTSGCMSLRADITLDHQARATGSVVISVNKQVASFAGIGSAEAFKAALTENAAELPAGALETSESDTDYIATVSLKNAVLDDPEFKAEVFADGNVRFTYANTNSDSGTGNDTFGDMDMGSATLTVNFPGEVTEFSGEGATKVDADTVKWTFPLTSDTTANATSLVAANSLPFLPIAIGVLALAVVAGVVLLAIRRRPSRVVEAVQYDTEKNDAVEPDPVDPSV